MKMRMKEPPTERNPTKAPGPIRSDLTGEWIWRCLVLLAWLKLIINCIDRFWKKDSDSLLEKLCVDKEIFAVARLFVIKILRLDEVFFFLPTYFLWDQLNKEISFFHRQFSWPLSLMVLWFSSLHKWVVAFQNYISSYVDSELKFVKLNKFS